jgi:hypothetical protein
MRNLHKILFRSFEERDHMGVLVVDGGNIRNDCKETEFNGVG